MPLGKVSPNQLAFVVVDERSPVAIFEILTAAAAPVIVTVFVQTVVPLYVTVTVVVRGAPAVG